MERCKICKNWFTKKPADNYRDTKGICLNCRSKRLITVWEETVLRICHHDFFGYSIPDAACELETSIAEIKEALATVKGIAKRLRISLFPILTSLENDCCSLYINNYMTYREIAKSLSDRGDCGKISANAASKAVLRARDKGLYVPSKKYRNPKGHKMIHFDERWMSNFVKMKF